MSLEIPAQKLIWAIFSSASADDAAVQIILTE